MVRRFRTKYRPARVISLLSFPVNTDRFEVSSSIAFKKPRFSIKSRNLISSACQACSVDSRPVCCSFYSISTRLYIVVIMIANTKYSVNGLITVFFWTHTLPITGQRSQTGRRGSASAQHRFRRTSLLIRKIFFEPKHLIKMERVKSYLLPAWQPKVPPESCSTKVL